MLRGLILAAALTASSIALAAEPKSAADALAQKFSGAPDTATESKSAPAAKAPAKAVKTAEPEKKAVVAAEQAVPDRPSLDYEMDMLRRARAERAEQQKPSTPLTNAPAAMPAPASAPATAPASTGKIVVTPPAAPASPASSAVATTAAPAAAAASSTAPSTTAASSAPTTSRLVTPSAPVVPPAKVVEATPKAATPAPAVQAKADAPVADPKTTASAAAPAMPAAKASVLLAIETGGASSKSGNAQDFDPIICLADTCFVSNGLSGDAITLGKADALKLKSTKDASQAACQGMAGCVFRNVGIPSGAQIQVVDLGAPSTEPGRTYDAQLDKTCATAENELACENPIASPDFRIWIVPEEAAKTAGTEAIEDAVADGLPHRDIARDTDK